MTPQPVARQMADLIVPNGDRQLVLDPAAGEGALLAAARERLAGCTDPQTIHLVGVEIDARLAGVADERLKRPARARSTIMIDDFLQGGQTGESQLLEVLRAATIVIANPPYGDGREYEFFCVCNDLCAPGTQLIFLVPLEFADRVQGLVSVVALRGRPLGVTTGHAIVRHIAGTPVTMRPARGSLSAGRFTVLTGIKLYERGGGRPKQTQATIEDRPFSSSDARQGWLPCVRTGDIQRQAVTLGRLWVDYGDHLAHPKDLARFTGPKLFVRRMPIWKERAIGAAFLARTALCASDVLVVREASDDAAQLRGLCQWLSGSDTASLMHERKPLLTLRDSFPKFSGKDLAAVLRNAPDHDSLYALDAPKVAGQQCPM
jgi:hypothetical protein